MRPLEDFVLAEDRPMDKGRLILMSFPFNLPGTYYRAIGEVIARAALFEMLVMEAIAEIAKIEDKKMKRVFFMTMQIKPKLGVLKNLSNNWLRGDLRSEFLSIVKEALPLINFRHMIAHGVWGREQGKKTMRLQYIEESKDVYIPNSAPTKSRAVRQVAIAIHNLNVRLDNATRSLQASHAP